MATQRWSTKGFKVSDDTKDLKNKYNTSNQNYNSFVNNGVQTSSQTTEYWNRLQDLQKNNKLSNTFNYGNQAGYNNALNALTNREAFKYDLSNDQLYQQAKDQYQQMGKTAMADTVGQASAMTGGYGNSYATTAGSQAYQSYLQQLNNNIADYYNLALGAYNSETDRLQGNFNAFATDRGQQASEWAQNWGVYNERFNNLSNAWANSRDYDLNSYNTQATQLGNVNAQNYNAYNDSESRDVDLWKTSNDNLLSLYGIAQNQQQIDESVRHNKATETETARANNLDYLYKLSSGSSNSGTNSGNNVTTTEINKVLNYAKNMKESKKYEELANYLNNLDSKFDSEIPLILNSIGLSSNWISEYSKKKDNYDFAFLGDAIRDFLHINK
ncbi:MAG: hypothetical protein ACI4RI_04910 [Ruminococcus sp.]